VGKPYITFDWDALEALAASLSPTNNLDEMHQKLEERSAAIARLPVWSNERQLLAALRGRAMYLSEPLCAPHRRKDDLMHWLRLQRSSPLNA
jgi:hypothetical protein